MKREILKRWLRVGLLIFICATIGRIAVSYWGPVQKQNELPEGLSLVVWHAEKRCLTCRSMEEGSRECLENFFPENEIRFLTRNYEAPENAQLAERFRIATAGVFLVFRENGTEAAKNLTDPAWKTVGDRTVFVEMLRDEIEAFCRERSLGVKRREIPEKWEQTDRIEVPKKVPNEDPNAQNIRLSEGLVWE